MQPTVGRIVHFHPFPGSMAFAALVVGSFGSEEMANLEVFTDGLNGQCDPRYGFTAEECAAGRAWRTSVHAQQPDQVEGASWVWPPRAS